MWVEFVSDIYEDNELCWDMHAKDLVDLLFLPHSIKLWLNEFYIHQFLENVTEPTDKDMRVVGYEADKEISAKWNVKSIASVSEIGLVLR